jgi:hypothetical protein
VTRANTETTLHHTQAWARYGLFVGLGHFDVVMHPFLQELLEAEWRLLNPAGELEESELADVASAVGGMIVANREKLMNRLRVQKTDNQN